MKFIDHLEIALRAEAEGDSDLALKEFQLLKNDEDFEVLARLGLARCFERKKFFDLAEEQLNDVLKLVSDAKRELNKKWKGNGDDDYGSAPARK